MKRGEPPVEIPQRIISFWAEGESQAPEIVKRCWSRWRRLNPEYSLTILDRRQALDLLALKGSVADAATLQLMSPQALSDILRATILCEAGGIWVDAALYPIQPLAQWFDRNANQFFAFAGLTGDRPISSWFLASVPRSVILSRWSGDIYTYWDRPRSLIRDPRDGPAAEKDPIASVSSPGGADTGLYPYFWFHYLFLRRLKTDPAFEEAWSNAGKLPARPAHAFQAACASSSYCINDLISASTSSVVQKLDWRHEILARDVIAAFET